MQQQKIWGAERPHVPHNHEADAVTALLDAMDEGMPAHTRLKLKRARIIARKARERGLKR